MTIDAIPSHGGARRFDSAALTADEWSLAALLVPPGSRAVAIVGADSRGALERALTDRDCSVEVVASVPAALEHSSGVAEVDTVVLGEGFETLEDPIGALAALADAVGESGRVVLVADNAASAANHIRVVRGEVTRTGDLPPRSYDLGAIERVVDRAGLVVTDRLRAVDPPVSVTESREADSLNALPEARTRRFVLVVERAARAAGMGARSAAEALQAALNDAEAEAAKIAEQRDALERSIEDLTEHVRSAEALAASLRTDADDARVELSSREAALVERVEEAERLHVERRHLQLDLAVKDEYISEIRAQLLGVLNELGGLRETHEALLRSRQYRSAALLYRVMRRIPFLHRLVQGTTDRVVPVARRILPRP